MNVDTRKPIIEPVAAFKARVKFPLSKSSSPINAPTNGPIRKTSGIGAMRPTINPMLVHQMPYVLPPNCLVPCAVIR